MSDNWNTGGDSWTSVPASAWNGDTAADGNTWVGDDSGVAQANDEFNARNTEDPEKNGDEIDHAGLGQACRNCGQDGHYARECSEPRKTGACFNCGEEGHTKADCPQPRVFKGQCNICQEEGHAAAKCPSKPCPRCKGTGHEPKGCKNNFNMQLEDVPDVPDTVAWAKLGEACHANDIDDFKEALRLLQKAAPEVTYPAVEKHLRKMDWRFFLIALKKEVSDGYTLVNLQGEPDQSFSVAIFKSPACQRPNMVDKWPSSKEENMTRLANAGIPMERGIPYCRVCEQYGHIPRECTQERTETGPAVVVRCALCDQEGHRVRDCTEPRKKPREPRTCKICGSEDHLAKECDQRQVFKCRNCDQEGHKASECTEPRKIICNNCDKEGHIGRECDQPTDWSRRRCRHCGEMGHASANRCKPGAAKPEAEGKDKENDFENAIANDSANANGNDWDAGNTFAAGGWESGTTTAPAAASGGW